MKKKWLSAILAMCVLGTFSGVGDCECRGVDCGFVSQAIRSEAFHCQPAAAHAERRDPSGEECCGKCGIEKAAVLSRKISFAGDVRPWSEFVEIQYSPGIHSKIEPLLFFKGELFESPPGFFEQHILGTTFSFRAPPQGHVL
ncbi:MAG: hypothetical protein V1882_01000 [Candidatus Omnitrophota bacterium]